MKSAIYHALSQKEAKELDVQHPGAQRAEAFVRAFLKRSTPRLSQQAREDQLQRKAVVLEYFARRPPKEKRKRCRGLSARQRRGLRLFDVKPEQQRYNLFLPLHELWKQYIRDLCGGLKPDTQPQVIQAKLLKADLHGAVISGPPPVSRGHAPTARTLERKAPFIQSHGPECPPWTGSSQSQSPSVPPTWVSQESCCRKQSMFSK
ncbi:ribonuclease P protein subunit p29 isoform X3 [Pteropus alecto]|uniref:ribonuclease P protein subunit p29 isoform X3 n=1 Tax=Pteropus alecto TaxID=9402 RepID=UPI000D53AFBC|nr:ribonuclease P protein subunit p29 isoform X3 [Pteropus alecto]